MSSGRPSWRARPAGYSLISTIFKSDILNYKFRIISFLFVAISLRVYFKHVIWTRDARRFRVERFCSRRSPPAASTPGSKLGLLTVRVFLTFSLLSYEAQGIVHPETSVITHRLGQNNRSNAIHFAQRLGRWASVRETSGPGEAVSYPFYDAVRQVSWLFRSVSWFAAQV